MNEYAGRGSRRAEVLDRLREASGEWVDGFELANQYCGGSEGIRRLRELRAMGYLIDERRHPNPHRNSWQYRLVVGGEPVRDDDQMELHW